MDVKRIIFSQIAAVFLAAAVSAEPEPYYGYGHLYNAYPNWPGVRAPGFSSTCYGCRPYHYLGKRSADAEPEPYYGYGYGFAPYGYGLYGYGRGVAGHPTGTSFVARSPQGLRGKRSAEPFYGYGYGYAPFGYYGYPYGPGIAGHPGRATSYTQRSPQGLGK